MKTSELRYGMLPIYLGVTAQRGTKGVEYVWRSCRAD